MLNAIVSPTKEDLCYCFHFIFLFCFAKGLVKCKFGVFDKSQILHILTILFTLVNPLAVSLSNALY
jgi:hypothetical protein